MTRMCKNITCPSHKECYRFNREPHPLRQDYVAFAPADGEIACDMFLRFELQQAIQDTQGNVLKPKPNL